MQAGCMMQPPKPFSDVQTHLQGTHEVLGLQATHCLVLHSLSTVLTFCNHYHFNLELLLLRLGVIIHGLFLETAWPVSLVNYGTKLSLTHSPPKTYIFVNQLFCQPAASVDIHLEVV